MMNYSEASEYLKKAAARGSILGLERISELMKRLGNPQNKLKIIHVAGTNGKGSFGAMMTSVLKSAGYKTGSFSSPAITDVTDSFRIDCNEISKEEFADIIGEIAPVCESMDEKPTEFEVLTAAAFQLFCKKKCDIAVVECGMGGDTDSTNVIEKPLLSVITNVRKDHCAFLGDSLEEIAVHKAGIIKKDCIVFFGGSNDDAVCEIIRKTAEEKKAPLYTMDCVLDDVKFSYGSYYGIAGVEFGYRGVQMNIPLLGTYQYSNALNVLSCVEILRKNGIEISYSALKDGFANTKWHGRFEMLRKEPVVIFDGAHNPDGIEKAADSIRRYFGKNKVVLLIGVMADKEYSLYADMLGDLIDCVFAVTPDNPRALDSRILAETFAEKGISSSAFQVLEQGVNEAYLYAKSKSIPLIALGSLYMYKEFVEALEKIQ